MNDASEVLERIADGFLAIDREWRITYVNAAAERTARRSRAELVGQNVWEAYPDIVGTQLEREYRRASEQQVPVEFETYYPPLDVWAAVRVFPSPSGLTVLFQDITATKRAQLALAASEARYRLIVETAHEGIWLVDAEYRTKWANARMAELLGTSLEELHARGVAGFVHDADLPLLRQQIADRRAGRAGQYDIRLTGPGGRVVWVLARVAPVFAEDGTFAGALGMFSDITDRKRSEAELVNQREWFHVTLASIGDAVIATDAEGRITFMNAVAEELTAWAGAEARGRPLPEVFHIVHEETRKPAEDPVAKVLREKRVVGLANHTALIARDGTERPIDDSGAPIRGADGEILGVVLVFRDNTDRARAERELREADRRKDEFLAMLAHELRNPLAPMRSALELMRVRPDDPPTLLRTREILERQVRHMTRLVDDLLDVSRITRGQINLQRERVDVATTMSRAVETIAPSIDQRRQVLRVRPPAEPLVLDADPTRVAQVIANLLHNASKFTPERGHIELTAERDGASVVIRVRDDGAGIRADALPRIFEPFTQVNPSLDRAQGGLGLGLTLVKTLVDLHGGSVEARSGGAGQGSEFTVRLPLPDGADAARSHAEATRLAERLRILVVDDNVDAADMLALLLGSLGHQTSIAHDGLTALRHVEREVPDLVLLDIGLPGIDGYEVARRLRGDGRCARLKLLALSGYGQESDKRCAAQAGFDAHLVKPVDMDTLVAAVARLFPPAGAER